MSLLPYTNRYLSLMGMMGRVTGRTRDWQFAWITFVAGFVFILPCLVLDLLFLPFLLIGKALGRNNSN